MVLGMEPQLIRGGTPVSESPQRESQLSCDRVRREEQGLGSMTSGVSSIRECGDSSSASHAHHTVLVHTRHSMNRTLKLL